MNSLENQEIKETEVVCIRRGSHKELKTVASPIPLDQSLIQVVANKKELDRRITAFCKRKRDELDRANLLEFCNVKEEGVVDSCARVVAMLYRKAGSKSYLRTSRVKNSVGPHISDNFVQSGDSEVKKIKLEISEPSSVLPVPLENRVGDLEKRLKLSENTPVPGDIYSRLKALEDRLEMLEGISPEYCQPVKVETERNEREELEQKKTGRKAQVHVSLSELDERILNLKNLLNSQVIKAEADSD